MHKKNTTSTKFMEMVKGDFEYSLITLGGIAGLFMSLYIIIHMYSTAVSL